MNKFAVIAASLVLVACDQINIPGAKDSDEPAPPQPEAVQATKPSDAFTADIKVSLSSAAVVQITSLESVSTTLAKAAAMPDPAAFETVYDADLDTIALGRRSSGGTGGAMIDVVVFQIQAADVAKFAGKTITVKFLAKSDKAASIYAGFSTASVGHSGWQEFALSDSFAEYSFDYEVGADNVNRDFLGFVPKDGNITVAAAGLDIQN